MELGEGSWWKKHVVSLELLVKRNNLNVLITYLEGTKVTITS